ncbi:IS3 family transposase [Actinomyces bowdenii]|uniref:IS3 family transposase n=1 Tax=Actinomyces bowdenii TaxID=131109 RepID=UPI0035A317DE
MSAVGRRYPDRATCSWRDGPQSRRDIRRQELASMIDTEFKACHGTYGYRRITAGLGRRGVSMHHQDTVRGLMRQTGLVVQQPH